MTDTTKYPINAETGLPALPEGYRWFVDSVYGDFRIVIQREQNTGEKFVIRPRNFWEKFTMDYTERGSYQTVTLVGEDRWKMELFQTILTLESLSSAKAEDDDGDTGVFVKDIAKILTPEIILANAKILVEKFDKKRQAKESEKYVGAYPPGKLNRD